MSKVKYGYIDFINKYEDRFTRAGSEKLFFTLCPKQDNYVYIDENDIYKWTYYSVGDFIRKSIPEFDLHYVLKTRSVPIEDSYKKFNYNVIAVWGFSKDSILISSQDTSEVIGFLVCKDTLKDIVDFKDLYTNARIRDSLENYLLKLADSCADVLGILIL